MTIVLKDISLKNFSDVGRLAVSDDQTKYVASNFYSISEAQFSDAFRPRAVYWGDTPVGFVMYALVQRLQSPDECDIFRFMIDQNYQGRGLGRKAMELVLGEIKAMDAVARITICYVASNTTARDFYGSFGFVELEQKNPGGEVVAEIRL
ncbi:GNAT family N-acetyltransferase [Marinobacter caseinilyticus]|uniref:GNAT family N-acetyltransferase n=1 Tax=Marinobacter caseinilyticus TaxID=2692195 RepID=UPI00140E37FF|nr:GNAT family N-acetyltransferase [Marinobacter caseinilyticus]